MSVEAQALLAELVADDFDAWGASAYEEYWQCHWCRAHGAGTDEEPREADHTDACPWARARRLVAQAGHGGRTA
jgi:hypothetical protein